MKSSARFYTAIVMVVVCLLGLYWLLVSPLTKAQELCVADTTLTSPLTTFYSPLAAPLSAEAQLMFSNDVVDNPQTGNSAIDGFSPAWNRTSDFMAGRVAVGIVLPESNGVMMSSSENWTPDEIAFVTQKIYETLSWWEQRANERGVSLEFVVPLDHPRVVSCDYEPIQMIGMEDSYGDADVWINNVIIHLGYDDPGMNYIQRVQQHDDDLRRTQLADWAFTVFVANGTNDGDGAFAPGSWGYPDVSVMAWARRPGPYTVVNTLSAVGASWPDKFYLNNILAHEIGHVFGAADEVWANGSDCGTGSECSAQFGYLSVVNQNCDRSPQCAIDRPDCVMRAGDLDYLCPYSAGQIGWRDSDSDGLADPVDTTPQLTVASYPANPSPSHILDYAAQVTDIPYSTSQTGYVPVSINTVSVQYRIGTAGTWVSALPGDGSWDSSYEENFKIAMFVNGTYTIYLRAINEAGHVSTITHHTVTVNSSELVYRVFLPAALKG